MMEPIHWVAVGFLVVAAVIAWKFKDIKIALKLGQFEGKAQGGPGPAAPGPATGAIRATSAEDADAETRVHLEGADGDDGAGSIDIQGSADRAKLRTNVTKTGNG